MKKVVLILFIMALLVPCIASAVPAQKSPAAAGLLSLMMPGTGEWYNNNWQGGFPWGECVIGKICFLFNIASVVDAVDGDSGDGMRLDFWSAPK